MGTYIAPESTVQDTLALSDVLGSSTEVTPGGGNNEGPGIGDIGGIFG